MWSSAMVAILKGRGKRDVKDDKNVEKKAD
jgi:hypothetical protein